VAVLGAVTLFTNLSFNGGLSVASADTSNLYYNADTKTLTVGTGDLPVSFTSKANVTSAETIIFVSPTVDSKKVVIPAGQANLFANLTNLKEFKGMQNLDTSNMTTMYCMFKGDGSLTAVDLSHFDTTAVIDQMDNVFDGCSNLKTVDLSNFKTAGIKYMDFMFSGCSSLETLNLSSFDTQSLSDSGGTNMFYGTNAMWKLTLGPLFYFKPNPNLQNPIVGTRYNQNYIVDSTKWINVATQQEYTAAEMVDAHNSSGVTDTYTWQGRNANETTVEYVIEPSYTVTIPAKITIPSATTVGTENVTLSAYPKLPFAERFIHVSAASNAATAWHLTSTGDTTGAEYNLGTTSGGCELKTSGGELTFTADGEVAVQNQAIYAGLTDSAHNFKYAGAYQDTVTFTIQTAAS
jgi:surface protein